ncbi:diacylglycerol O-acyltransferase 1-like [Orbicella faveolata]|uniref:diacylglycerol O-acyltransferase 1-like n=1 Tax=Orbicella faveolata TaxID=48498 RepID=UPI0009E4099D|nr:diacylglycerol O-acyltransferase 1-like [Orbicella faveolata]
MSSTTLRHRSTPKRVEKSTETKSKTKNSIVDYGTPVHKCEESLLTSTSGFDNYRGLVNLCLVLLILSNFRLALDNVLKYGLLIDPVQVITIFLEDPYRWPSASLVIFSNVFIQAIFCLEKLLALGKISERIGRFFHFVFLLTMLIVPCTVVLVFHPPPCKYTYYRRKWIVPTVKNSWKPIQEMDLGRGLERVMKLAVPNHLIWLLCFYAFFHSGLNVTAEVLKFGDRTFYKDWWNSPNVAYFWQNWNIPVHRWARRHLYTPMLQSGYSSRQAQVAVFLLSAFFHEFLVSVPLRLFRFWAFLAMLSQVS